MADEWFYIDAMEAQQGPLTVVELEQMFETGAITLETWVWQELLPDWSQISNLPELKAKMNVQLHRASARKPDLPSKPAARAPRATTETVTGAGRLGGAAARRNSINQHWVEKRTADGMPFYYNVSTEAVSWDKPEALMTHTEKQEDLGEWVWVSDPKVAWAPAKVVRKTSSGVEVQLGNGRPKVLTKSKAEPLWPLKKSSLNHLEEDLVMVDDLNQGLMMHCLRERYARDKIYTWVGANHTVLISVNPFKQLPIYSIETMSEFAKPGANRVQKPHVFAIAQDSFTHMKIQARNQAILISGESGAGKTEATKQCLAYLAEMAGSDNNVEQKILSANPVLEAFGNAKTLRNNNSSRFGRWMEVHFEPTRGYICGCKIENYLLEKCRVTFQQAGERNFHIFYQLCKARQGEQYGLGDPTWFRYLNQSGCTTVRNVDDVDDFSKVLTSFRNLSFEQDTVEWLLSLVAAVLHIGNVEFESDGDQGSRVKRASKETVENVSRLLGLSYETIDGAFTSRTIHVRGTDTHILHKPADAVEAADALAKAIFGKLFDWLVLRINDAVQFQMDNSLFIGVLDIFGFEIFEQNSFEQLCINFTNEKLQQHFNRSTFKEEESVYQSEGIRFAKVPFIDNQPILDLIEKKPFGLMVLLDEEVRLPQGSDSRWIQKCTTKHASNPNWQEARRGQSADVFAIQHYAGNVQYSSLGFMEKNKDSLYRNMYDMMSAAPHPLTREVFPPKDANPRRVQTLGEKFRSQLRNLMTVVDRCEPYYIRCIKPNHEKKANMFEIAMSIEQLTYAGVFEAVQIRKAGFPFRLPHGHFFARYNCAAKEKLYLNRSNPAESCRRLLAAVPQDFSEVQIGNTLVLYRANEHRVLELLRNLKLELILPMLQRQIRRAIGWRYLRKVREVFRICKGPCEVANDYHALTYAVERSEELIAPMRPLFPTEPHVIEKARRMRFALKERNELTQEFSRLVQLDPATHFDEYFAALQRAERIADLPGTEEEMNLENRCRERLGTVAGVKVDPLAREALNLLDKHMMEQVMAEANRYFYRSEDTQEIERLLGLPEEELVKLQLKKANELGDPDRIINREIRLKEMFLVAYGSLFKLPMCSILKDPEAWAASKFFGLAFNKKELAAGMLKHSTNPIHSCLTDVESEDEKKLAVRQFRSMQAYMGDRAYPYPDQLIAEYLQIGLAHPNLRAEFYVQLMKQLVDNPSQDSVQKGWEILVFMLSSFPPPKSVENFVALFIRDHAPSDTQQKFSHALHASIYGGARTKSITLPEFPTILSKFYEQEISAKYGADDYVSVRRADRASPKTVTSSSPQGPAAPATGPPPAPVKSVTNARVLFDFTPDGDDGTLAIKANTTVEVLDSADSDWWMAKRQDGMEGWVPRSYVQMA